ncbi:MAG: hypothetical protein ACN4E2_04645 [Nitrospinota bacterium]
MKKFTLVTLLLSTIIVLLSTNVFANDTGTIWGENYLYSLEAPKGWVLDTVSGKSNGLQAVFYPKGGSWADSKAVMYTNVAVKKSGQNNIEEFINYSLSEIKVTSPTVTVKDLGTRSVNNKKIVLKEWLHNERRHSQEQHEMVAYIEESKVIVLMVLTSKNQGEYKKSIKALRALVESYMFHSDNPDYKAVSEAQLKPLIEVAKKQSKTKKGGAYEEQVSQMIGSYIGTVLKGCGENLKKMDNIDALFQVNKFGISTVTYWSQNDTSQCFIQNGILNWVFPKPPIDNFHYHIEVKIKP